MALSAADLERFHRDGFIVVRQLVSPDTIAALMTEVDGLHEQMAAAKPKGVGLTWEDDVTPPRIRQLMNSQVVSPIIDQVMRSDAMLDIVEQLVGPDIILYHSKLMMKSAQDGSFTPWHQDWGYWQASSVEPTQVNGMLAIDAATIENGCIRFVPGSHKDGAIEHQNFHTSGFTIGLPGDIDAYPDAVPVELAPGDVVFFGPLVIHGSAPNNSAQHRRANTFAFDRVGNRKQGPDHAEQLLRGQLAATSV